MLLYYFNHFVLGHTMAGHLCRVWRSVLCFTELLLFDLTVLNQRLLIIFHKSVRTCLSPDNLDIVDGPLVMSGASMLRLPPAQLNAHWSCVAWKLVGNSLRSEKLHWTVYRYRLPLNTLHMHNRSLYWNLTNVTNGFRKQKGHIKTYPHSIEACIVNTSKDIHKIINCMVCTRHNDENKACLHSKKYYVYPAITNIKAASSKFDILCNNILSCCSELKLTTNNTQRIYATELQTLLSFPIMSRLKDDRQRFCTFWDK